MCIEEKGVIHLHRVRHIEDWVTMLVGLIDLITASVSFA